MAEELLDEEDAMVEAGRKLVAQAARAVALVADAHAEWLERRDEPVDRELEIKDRTSRRALRAYIRAMEKAEAYLDAARVAVRS
jgi:hypothetical protein